MAETYAPRPTIRLGAPVSGALDRIVAVSHPLRMVVPGSKPAPRNGFLMIVK
jgi:hypothetical protein